ncbi:MAG: hypothetical protein NT002_09915 [candidate division Zixibacteria bacterium]|nr:hypothetical protein [candidate division Zixibacteria bacterium]
MSILVNRTFRIAMFVAIDVIAVGMGMGVPIFAILLGFPVGWFLPAFLGIRSPYTSGDLRAVLRAAALTSGVTLLITALIWLPALRVLGGPPAKIANFGIPLILYQPLPSFIAWIVLMVIISPILQMLTTLLGCILRYALRPPQQPTG